MHKTVVLLVAFIFGSFLLGCDSKPQASAQDEPSEESAHAASNKSSEEPAAEAPRAKETHTLGPDELGVLPEGIGLEVGEQAPDVGVSAADGSGEVNLLERAAEQPLLVIFYRGGWCPFCNYQIRQLSTNYEPFEERGVLPVLISVDQMGEAAKTEQAYEIPFPVLADPDLEAHKGFNVVYEADDEEVERLRKMGLDIEKASGRDHHSYAVPSAFVVSKEGEVLWSHANLDYRKRPTIEQLVAVLDETL